MKSALILSLVASLPRLLPQAHAQSTDADHGVVFEFPTEGMTLHFKDIANVTYTSPFSSPRLYTFCGKAVQKRVDFVNPFNSSALIDLDWTGSETPCWFDLRPDTTAGHGANSPHFAYIASERTSTTVGIPTTTQNISPSNSAAFPTTSTTSSITSSTAETTQISDSRASSNALSTGAIAGIGVGVGLVVIGLAVAAAIVFMRRKAGYKTVGVNTKLPPPPPHTGSPNMSTYTSSSAEVIADFQKPKDYPRQHLPHEMDYPTVRHELGPPPTPHELHG
ncbi:hypothetical protein F5Y18DRAFT_425233 [Xylariaceae sp. FL1019]|nr:hypothetical protein F5Y18DRAFT_425233 [Xylariaceae sp. FL1019]